MSKFEVFQFVLKIELQKKENELEKKEQQLDQREKKLLAEEKSALSAKSLGQVNPTFADDETKKQQHKELDELRILSTKQSNEIVQKNREIENLKSQVRRANADLAKATPASNGRGVDDGNFKSNSTTGKRQARIEERNFKNQLLKTRLDYI